jgi:type II secretory pathway component PulJ
MVRRHKAGGSHADRDSIAPGHDAGGSRVERVKGLGGGRPGFTLIEMMVAVALTILLMSMVVSVMSQVMENVSANRATIEMTDRLRYVRERLQKDLAGVTIFPNPPARPENGEGYFEYIEGPLGPQPSPGAVTVDSDEPGSAVDISGSQTNFDVDLTVGDLDDILMFTSKSNDDPFVGLWNNNTVESRVAEIAYFVRGTTLYRRVLLVRPDLALTTPALGTSSFYQLNDISAHQEDGPAPQNLSPTTNSPARLVANSLADLTKRENRYAHQPYVWPYDARFWSFLGLPTLRECSDPNWPFPYNNPTGGLPPASGVLIPGFEFGRQLVVPNSTDSSTPFQVDSVGRVKLNYRPGEVFDAWRNPFPWQQVDRQTGTILAYPNGTRFSEDVLLPNILSFDIKAWDSGAPQIFYQQNPDDPGTVRLPGDVKYLGSYDFINNSETKTATTDRAIGFGAFVDLWGFRDMDRAGITPPASLFTGLPPYPAYRFLQNGNPKSGVAGDTVSGPPYLPAVYDTWSTSYEQDGINQDKDVDAMGNPLVDEGANGIDDDGVNGVDDPGEQEAPPPYPYPLRAIQVKIRVFEPDSRQVREVTLVHEFLPQ